MGCDGGTIPKRKEIVKSKNKVEERDKVADLSAIWQFCFLSGLELRRPIVGCQLGRLYNKDAIVQHLLDSRASRSRTNPTESGSSAPKPRSTVSHIKSLKDVIELRLNNKPGSQANSSRSDKIAARFVCPISGLELNGKYKFYFPFTCGCIISERALKEVPNDKKCIICSTAYEPDRDLIVINGDESEVQQLFSRLTERRCQLKKVKREAQTSEDKLDTNRDKTRENENNKKRRLLVTLKSS